MKTFSQEIVQTGASPTTVAPFAKSSVAHDRLSFLHVLREGGTAIRVTLVLMFFLCGVYPLAVWAGAQLMFPWKANGSLVYDRNGTVIGSHLLAQHFASPGTFHPRPSAAGTGYDAANSGGTNLGPTEGKLLNGVHPRDAAGKEVAGPESFDGIRDLVTAYRREDGLSETTPVPADAVTRSGSGLDPHISVANAQLQAPRVATALGLRLVDVMTLIERQTEAPGLGFLGEPSVNVLELNRNLKTFPGAR